MPRLLLLLIVTLAAGVLLAESMPSRPVQAVFPGANAGTSSYTVLNIDDDSGEPLPGWKFDFYRGTGCDPTRFVLSEITQSDGRIQLAVREQASALEHLEQGWENITPLCQDLDSNGQAEFRNRRIPAATPTITATPTVTPTPGAAPDARGKIAFQRGDYDIYLANADRTGETRLTDQGSDPAWSPDGSQIAFRAFGGRIDTMSSDGSGGKLIIDWQPRDATNPAWSPDGSKIAFASDRDSPDRFVYHIYVASTDGTNVVQLTNGVGSDTVPSWSPDGTRIAFYRYLSGHTEIVVLNADGSANTSLASDLASYGRPSWSPDGSRIAISGIQDGNGEIFLISADGRTRTNITNNPAEDFEPDWSPDGSKLAFVSDRDGNREVYIMNADGSDVARLTINSEPDTAPDWQPVPLVGNANCIAGVNSIDALVVLQLNAGVITRLGCPGAADVNADGRIDPLDAALILQYVAGLLDHL